jgi:hypothetical protein
MSDPEEEESDPLVASTEDVAAAPSDSADPMEIVRQKIPADIFDKFEIFSYRRTAIMARYAIMSFSPSAERIARSMIEASECGPVTTSSKARSALSFQCQVSSNASICACDPSPDGALNRTL